MRQQTPQVLLSTIVFADISFFPSGCAAAYLICHLVTQFFRKCSSCTHPEILWHQLLM